MPGSAPSSAAAEATMTESPMAVTCRPDTFGGRAAPVRHADAGAGNAEGPATTGVRLVAGAPRTGGGHGEWPPVYRCPIPRWRPVERFVRTGKSVSGSRRGIMVSMKVEEADRFYEEDEDPEKVFAVFDAAEKGRTAPPSGMRVSSRWTERLRHEVAGALRRAANVIEPSP